LAARVYELEATVAQLHEAGSAAHKTAERAERERQRVAGELEAMHSTHARLESRFFAAEGDLAAANARLERAQRNAAALEASVQSREATLEREREAWRRTEADLRDELAAARRRVATVRRQTVSTTSHSRSTSLGRPIAFSPEMQQHAPELPPLSPPAVPLPDDSRDARAQAMQTQISQLMRRARDAEARAQESAAHAARIHAEAVHAVAALEDCQRRVEQLEHTVAQLAELNESLREDNESYQVLLQMSTIKGGISFANARTSVDSRASSGRCVASPTIPDDGSLPLTAAGTGSGSPPPGVARDLAAELGLALSLDGCDADPPARIAALEEQTTRLKEDLRKARYERRQMGEENKALSLYVNKILGRIMASAGGLEAVLSCDYDALAPGKPGASSYAAPPPGASSPRPVRSGSIRLARNSTPSKPLPRPQQPPPPPPVSLTLEPGTGDGVTSVFVPPTSPMRPAARQLPASPQSPPPYSRRTRSATVAAGPASERPSRDSCGDASATIGPASGGTWWKRMSIRLGGGWNAPDEPQPGTDA
ncbi:hypothetical protein IWQ57_004758, partial [Coemansia nantahalensis]